LSFIVGDEGQKLATKTFYAPLPAAAQEKALAIIRSMTFEGKPLVAEE
jgi:phosphate transport system substrate-binding protein